MNWLSKLLNPLPSPTLAPPPARVVPQDPPLTGRAALLRATDKTQALALLTEVQDESDLTEIALQARLAEVRLAAAMRIESADLLEQLARDSRDKDKRVYRHCADTLKQRRKLEAGARRAEEIAAVLHGLLAHTPLPAATSLMDLKKQLAALADAGDAGIHATALLDQAFARQGEEACARRDLQAAHNAAAALSAECAHAAWPWEAHLEGWRERLETLRITSAPAWLAHDAAALDAALARIESHIEALAEDCRREHAGDAFLTALEQAEVKAADPALWAAQAQPEHVLPREALARRWQALLAQVKKTAPAPEPEAAPVEKPIAKAAAKYDRDALKALLDRLEQALEEGHLADADKALQKTRNLLAGESLHGSLESRLHGLQARLEQLHGWARWGTVQARDKLIEAAQALLQGERDIEELAAAITGLRDQWKALNPHGPAGKGQWEKFDKTLETAYLPVAAQRAEQAARQAEARAAREALMTGWETELAGIDWEQADFKAIETRRSQILQQWREVPHASFRDERALRPRFDPLIARFDQHLEAARTREIERREAIILEAETLHSLPDPRRAATAAKNLQQRWTQQGLSVRLPRAIEQKLWGRFRAACNAVFTQLDAQRAEQDAQQQEQSRARQGLLDALAASLEGQDAGAIVQAMGALRDALEAGQRSEKPHPSRDGKERPPRERPSHDAPAQELLQRAQQRLAELRGGKHRRYLESLAQKAALAHRLETAALTGEALETLQAEIQQAWDALPHGAGDKALARRLAQAGQITPAQLAEGQAKRDALLLDLEITLDLPTPAALMEARRERQLSRLKQHFGAGSESSSSPEEKLILCHAAAAPQNPESDRRIQAILSKIVAG